MREGEAGEASKKVLIANKFLLSVHETRQEWVKSRVLGDSSKMHLSTICAGDQKIDTPHRCRCYYTVGTSQ